MDQLDEQLGTIDQCVSMIEMGLSCEKNFCPTCGLLGGLCNKTCHYGLCMVCGDCWRDSRLSATSPDSCDDGNQLDGDGCSSTCTVEEGWTCQLVTPSWQVVMVDQCVRCADSAGWMDRQGFTCADYAALGACTATSKRTDPVVIGGQIFQTPSYFKYKFAYDLLLNRDSPLLATFEVRAANDAHLFVGLPGLYGFEVILGGWGNTRSAIRAYPSQDIIAQWGGTVLDADVAREFWLYYDVAGNLSLGMGGIVFQHRFAFDGNGSAAKLHGQMQWGGPDRVQLHLATGWRTNGTWAVHLLRGSATLTIADLARAGYDASSACCVCGGGMRGTLADLVDDALLPPPGKRKLVEGAAPSVGATLDGTPVLLGRPSPDGFTMWMRMRNCTMAGCVLNAIVVPEIAIPNLQVPLSDVWPQLRSPSCRLRAFAVTKQPFRWRAFDCGMSNGARYAAAFHLPGSAVVVVELVVPWPPLVAARALDLRDVDPNATRAAGIVSLVGAEDEASTFQYRLFWHSVHGGQRLDSTSGTNLLAAVINVFAGGGLRNAFHNECLLDDCAWMLADARSRPSELSIRHRTTGECLCYRQWSLQIQPCPKYLMANATESYSYVGVGEGCVVSVAGDLYVTAKYFDVAGTAERAHAALQAACSAAPACVGYALGMPALSAQIQGALSFDAQLLGGRGGAIPSRLDTGATMSQVSYEGSTAAGPPAADRASFQLGRGWHNFSAYAKVPELASCLWSLREVVDDNNKAKEYLIANVSSGCLCQVPVASRMAADGQALPAPVGAAASALQVRTGCIHAPYLLWADMLAARYCEWTWRAPDPTTEASLAVDAGNHMANRDLRDVTAPWISSWAGAPAWVLANSSRLNLDTPRVLGADHTHALWIDLKGFAPRSAQEGGQHSFWVARHGDFVESCLQLRQRTSIDNRLPVCRTGALGADLANASDVAATLSGDMWAIGLQSCGSTVPWDSGADIRVPANSSSSWVLLVAAGSGASDGNGNTTFYASGPLEVGPWILEVPFSCVCSTSFDAAAWIMHGCTATATIRDAPREDWRSCSLDVLVSLHHAPSVAVETISVMGGRPARGRELARNCRPGLVDLFPCVQAHTVDDLVLGGAADRVLRVSVKLADPSDPALAFDAYLYPGPHVSGKVRLACPRIQPADPYAPPSGSVQQIGSCGRTCAGGILEAVATPAVGVGDAGQSPAAYIGQAWAWDRRLSEAEINSLFHATRARYYQDYQVELVEQAITGADFNLSNVSAPSDITILTMAANDLGEGPMLMTPFVDLVNAFRIAPSVAALSRQAVTVTFEEFDARGMLWAYVAESDSAMEATVDTVLSGFVSDWDVCPQSHRRRGPIPISEFKLDPVISSCVFEPGVPYTLLMYVGRRLPLYAGGTLARVDVVGPVNRTHMLAPQLMPRSVEFVDTNPSVGIIGGIVTIISAFSEEGIDDYALYLGGGSDAMASNIGSVRATGAKKYALRVTGVEVAPRLDSLFVYTRNRYGLAAQGRQLPLQDASVAFQAPPVLSVVPNHTERVRIQLQLSTAEAVVDIAVVPQEMATLVSTSPDQNGLNFGFLGDSVVCSARGLEADSAVTGHEVSPCTFLAGQEYVVVVFVRLRQACPCHAPCLCLGSLTTAVRAGSGFADGTKGALVYQDESAPLVVIECLQGCEGEGNVTLTAHLRDIGGHYPARLLCAACRPRDAGTLPACIRPAEGLERHRFWRLGFLVGEVCTLNVTDVAFYRLSLRDADGELLAGLPISSASNNSNWEFEFDGNLSQAATAILQGADGGAWAGVDLGPNVTSTVLRARAQWEAAGGGCRPDGILLQWSDDGTAWQATAHSWMPMPDGSAANIFVDVRQAIWHSHTRFQMAFFSEGVLKVLVQYLTPGSTYAMHCYAVDALGNSATSGGLPVQTRCGPGLFAADLAGSGGCLGCPAGFYSGGGSINCTDCPAGQFSSGSSSACTVCPAGQFAPAGSARCVGCDGGWRAEAGSNWCSICPGGTFALASSENCTDCAPGRYAWGAGNSVCDVCAPGWYAPLQSEYCGECSAGQFSASEGASGCSVCPDGAISEPRSAVCAPCGAGRAAPGGSDSCTNCSAGQYAPVWTATCQPCTAGWFAASALQGSCEPCQPGEYSPQGAVGCTECGAGSFSTSAGSGTCVVCAGGMYSPGGNETCNECAPGWFAAAGSGECGICSSGSYATAGRENCTACMPGQFAEIPGSSICATCQAGRFAVGASMLCEACEAGRFAGPGSAGCPLCPGGSHSKAGSGNCTWCAAGRAAQAGSEKCAICAIGSSAKAGSSMCLPCNAGYFAAWPGGHVCHRCRAGRSAPAGRGWCSICRAGRSAAAGSASCSACAPGTAALRGSGLCAPCLAGRAAAGKSAECSICAAGSYAAAQAANCTPCPAGRFAGLNGSGDCEACTQGWYAAAAGTSCEQCPAGRFAPPESGGCNPCPPGTYASVGSSACGNCSAGRFAKAASAGCGNCGSNTFALTASGHCTRCTEGRSSAAGRGGVGSLAVPLAEECHQGFTLDGRAGGRIYDGHGALSAGASSRLLADYAEPYRSQILDYLFLPSFGAALHLLKVEIGGDYQTAYGSEPSHMHSRGDLSCNRGYEFWLLREARRRNPDIVCYALAWSVPAWVGGRYGVGSGLCSPDYFGYLVGWLHCARQTGAGPVQFLGIRNEQHGSPPSCIVGLRAALNSAGFGDTKLIMPDDSRYNEIVIKQVQQDAHFASALEGGGVGLQYPCYNPRDEVVASGLKYWDTEDHGIVADWAGGGCWGRTLNQNFIRMNMTSAIARSLVWSVYPEVSTAGNGFIDAFQPWSGSYTVRTLVWITAHTTQFVQVGWTILDTVSGSSGYLRKGGSYVTYMSPGRDQFATVVEKLHGKCRACSTYPTIAEELTFTLEGGIEQVLNISNTTYEGYLSLSFWMTNETHHFHRLPNLVLDPNRTSFSFVAEPDTIYTISTCEGQRHGAHTVPVPPASPFPRGLLADDFDGYFVESTARYFADYSGSWQVARDPSDAAGNNQVFKQWVDSLASPTNSWIAGADAEPITLVGGNISDAVLEVELYLPTAAGGPSGRTLRAQSRWNGLCMASVGKAAWSGAFVDLQPCTDEHSSQFVFDITVGLIRSEVAGLCLAASASCSFTQPDVVCQTKCSQGAYDPQQAEQAWSWGDDGALRLRASPDLCLMPGGLQTGELLHLVLCEDPVPIKQRWAIVDQAVGAYAGACLRLTPPQSSILGRHWARQGYCLIVGVDETSHGIWQLRRDEDVLLAGHVASPLGTWHSLRLDVRGCVLQVQVDEQMATVVDATWAIGMAALHTSWTEAFFDNFVLRSLTL